MAYAKERYAKLLENVNQTFSTQLLGIESPAEFHPDSINLDINSKILKDIKDSLLSPLPVIIPEDFKVETKDRVSEFEKVDSLSLPSLVSLKCSIYDIWQKTKSSTMSIKDVKVEKLELLFLSQAFSAVQCSLIEKLLEDIVPLSDNVQYWDRYQGGLGSNLLYIAESIPQRTYLGVRSLSSFNSFQFRNNNNLFLWGSSMMRSPVDFLLKYHLKKARIEISSKKEKLIRLKEFNGAALGLISEMPDILEDCDKDLSKITSFLLKNIGSLSTLLDLLQGPPKSESQLDKLVKSSEEEFNSFNGTQEVYRRLLEVVQKLEQHRFIISKQISYLGPPSVWSQLFIPSVLSLFTAKSVWRFLLNNQAEILACALEAQETMIAFFKDWIVSPLQSIFDTIRNKNHHLAVMSKDSLESDMKSLERMAIEFALRKNPQGLDIDLERKLIQQGDLSTVLKAYESAIQNPLASAVFGDLIQTLLIQVQKAKVDAALALSALDTLLKSNELTFGLIAVIPPILLSWTCWNYFQRWWLRRTGQSKSHVIQKARITLTRIFRILNTQLNTTEGNNQDRYTRKGFLLCETHYLRQLASFLPVSKNQVDLHGFLKAVQDLETFSLSPSQRINVVQNMLLTYSFLSFKS